MEFHEEAAELKRRAQAHLFPPASGASTTCTRCGFTYEYGMTATDVPFICPVPQPEESP